MRRQTWKKEILGLKEGLEVWEKETDNEKKRQKWK